MKILEAQSATLTNYEVYNHLVEQETRYEKIKEEAVAASKKERNPKKAANIKSLGSRPGNLWTLRKELLEYFNEAPSPLACTPLPYNDDTIRTLLKELRHLEITKGEAIMMINLRPTKLENLSTIIEEMDNRFPGDEMQQEILEIITRVLGRPDTEAERQTMAENKQHLQKRQDDELKAQGGQGQKEQVEMVIDS